MPSPAFPPVLMPRRRPGRVVLACVLFTAISAADPEPPCELTAGIGAEQAPTFPGADSDDLRAVPIIEARLGSFTLSTVLLGRPLLAYEQRWFEGNLIASLGLALREGRAEDDDDLLRDQGDIDPTAMATATVRWTPGNSLLLLRGWVEADVLDQDHGLSATTQLLLRAPLPAGIRVQAGASLTWADDEHNDTWFGTRSSAALPAFRAGSGRREWGGVIEGVAPLSERWSVVGRATLSRLSGPAADSPLIEDREQFSATIGLTFRF